MLDEDVALQDAVVEDQVHEEVLAGWLVSRPVVETASVQFRRTPRLLLLRLQQENLPTVDLPEESWSDHVDWHLVQ